MDTSDKLHKQLFEQCIQDELQWSLGEEGRLFVQTAAEDQRQSTWTCDSFVVLGLDEACYLSALGQAEHSLNKDCELMQGWGAKLLT